MNRVLAILLILVLSNKGFAAIYYVNGISGRDHYDGKTKAKPFKTINRALIAVKGSDEIVIEGRQGNKDIVYYESLMLDKGKFSLKITGENSPVLDGSKFPNDSIPMISRYCGIFIGSNLVIVDGLTIRNFIYDGGDTTGVFGAGIYCEPGTMKNTFVNLTIENCNWGVYLDGNSLTKIDNLTIKSIQSTINGNAGTGICIMPGGSGIENNVIGSEKGNTIISAAKFGICFGRKGEVAFADNTAISKNVMQDCGQAGLIIYDIEGIAAVNQNTFQSNKIALIIAGMPIDTRISNNLFAGSESDSEIETFSDYDGFLLYDIWQRNGNKFSIPTYAAVNKDESKEEVIIGRNGGYIRNSIDAAQVDAGKENIIKKRE